MAPRVFRYIFKNEVFTVTYRESKSAFIDEVSEKHGLEVPEFAVPNYKLLNTNDVVHEIKAINLRNFYRSSIQQCVYCHEEINYERDIKEDFLLRHHEELGENAVLLYVRDGNFVEKGEYIQLKEGEKEWKAPYTPQMTVNDLQRLVFEEQRWNDPNRVTLKFNGIHLFGGVLSELGINNGSTIEIVTRSYYIDNFLQSGFDDTFGRFNVQRANVDGKEFACHPYWKVSSFSEYCFENFDDVEYVENAYKTTALLVQVNKVVDSFEELASKREQLQLHMKKILNSPPFIEKPIMPIIMH